MTATPITLFLIDDHTLLRRGLVALLSQYGDLRVVGEAGDAAEALRLLPQLRPDVILLDNHLPGVRGVDAIAGLREASQGSRVIMLTVSEDGEDLGAALRHGAQGYLLKTIDGDLLAQAIRRAARGEPVVSPEMMGKLVAAFQSQGAPEPDPGPMPQEDPAPQLSPREQEVLREIARGASNKEIARTLDIAETTVKIHVQHILRKLGLTSRVQAAVYASDRQRAE
ncbi:DNA-binding response regulator [Alicycliphilus denitrificans]|jgi:two-component system nitrate/nitrite response regulator NarL|uniref:response regulator n=1 Tax=Alicycliphilus denitrificans TaxID=179636 RepID=UPI0009695756|nr:response regulator [Alicycliphilus denitrificans]MBN9572623.1 response regulator [Alicycliphilus denitrificans]OJW82436.1 MAG: DNA-binding response regulator [Alicycliphilus sp. 69-12]BCN37209.1 DNA-binding response regulator [Alicycliphilus denitrificans]